MSNGQSGGLATAAKYYSDYGVRARELRGSGRKVIGYFSALCPVELLTAAGAVPIRLKGNVGEAITRADAYMETMICPFVRNVFDAAIKGRYSYLDGMVMPHQCDSLERTTDIWSYNLKLPYFHFLNYPHLADDPSIEFAQEIMRIFIGSLERFTGARISDRQIMEAIRAHNENRRTMRQLYDLRKEEAPRISGVEMMHVLVAAMSLPVDESTALVRQVIEEVNKREPSMPKKGCRIMLVGDQIDDVALVDLIEQAGAHLVMDDLSIGSKMYWEDVPEDGAPVEAIVERYLKKLRFPTTYVAAGATYEENLQARFGHLKKHINDFKVNGVILFIYKYCDPYGFEVPALKSYIQSLGVPVLYVEDEYSISSLARVKTRIEAFLEMIAG